MKLPWMKFYPQDWLSDPALSIVSDAARGVASDLMCIAFNMPERGVFKTNGKPWTLTQISRAVRGTSEGRELCVQELIEAGVLKKRPEGEIYWARIVRDEAARQMEREKKEKQRQAER
jgi:hypothetical protein